MATVDERRQRRARFSLSIAVLAVVTAVLAGMVITAHYAVTPVAPHPDSSPQTTTSSTTYIEDEEARLALAPMVSLPIQAAEPTALSIDTTGPPLTLLVPGDTEPATPEGAIGTLIDSDEHALAGLDPAVVAESYRRLALPGAPPVAGSTPYDTAATLRRRQQIAATGPVPGLSASYRVSQAQIKGTAQDGAVAVVCVLGELSVTWQQVSVSVGLGDCQAMRATPAGWRIAAGPRAAAAPNAWPGSAAAVRAGYREVRRGSR